MEDYVRFFPPSEFLDLILQVPVFENITQLIHFVCHIQKKLPNLFQTSWCCDNLNLP